MGKVLIIGAGGVGTVVAHKTSRKPWLVTMLADDWFPLYKAWLQLFGGGWQW